MWERCLLRGSRSTERGALGVAMTKIHSICKILSKISNMEEKRADLIISAISIFNVSSGTVVGIENTIFLSHYFWIFF